MIAEWFDKAIKSSELETDGRWRKWVKFVDRVDPDKKNGYAFVGEFLQDGTTDIDTTKPRLLLVASTTGSRKYQTTHYRVVILRPGGALEPTGIQTSNSKRGWALRIRDDIAALLAELSEEEPASRLEGFGDDELLAELRRRGLAS